MSTQNRPGRRPWQRPDASMSLLADLFSGTGLDPGYEEAARQGSGTRAGRTTRLLAATVILGLLCAIAIGQVRQGEPVAQRQRKALIAQIRQRTEESDALQRQAERLRAQTQRLRSSSLARSDEGHRARAELDRAAAAAAADPVQGPAIVVTVADAHGGHGEEDRDGRVYDRDLQGIVNALWSAGATAIAVNGQRLTATTAIRSAGDAILVDYRPLSPPYAVTAVGDSDRIGKAFAGSRAAQAFRTLKSAFGTRFDIREEGNVRLPAAPAPHLRYAREAPR